MSTAAQINNIYEIDPSFLSVDLGAVLDVGLLTPTSAPQSGIVYTDDGTLSPDETGTISLNGADPVALNYLGAGEAFTIGLLGLRLFPRPIMAFEADGRAFIYAPEGLPPLDALLLSVDVDENQSFTFADTSDGIVNGTDAGEDMSVGYVDADGDRISNDDDTIFGNGGNDTISAGDGNDTVSGGTGDDTIYGDGGDDQISGDSGNDTLFGGAGNDTLEGGSGNDVIFGDGQGEGGNTLIEATVDFGDLGASGTVVTGGEVITVGGVDVTVGINGVNPDAEVTVDDSAQFSAPGEGLGQGVGLRLYGGASANATPENPTLTSTTTLEFGSNTAGFADSVENVSFRINDIDIGPDNDPHTDIVAVRAFDPDGNLLDVQFTPSGNQIIDGDVIIAGDVDGGTINPLTPAGSVLVNVAGPVARIEIDYSNGGTTDQAVFVTDIAVSTVALDEGNNDDVLRGGDGDDILDGGLGADTVEGGDGRDTIFGGRGDVIDGGTGGDDYDILDLRGTGPFIRENVTIDADGDSESGTISFLDADGNRTGEFLTYIEIEEIVPCFTPGAVIATAKGERLVESLRVGDRIVTRDNGLQEIAWVGVKELGAVAQNLQPVLIRQGALGKGLPERDLLVSPNHRMLLTSEMAQLYFEEREVLVAAKHLVGLPGVEQQRVKQTTYIHFMFSQHEVVLADGSWSESFQPGDYTLQGIDADQRDEIFALFPELQSEVGLQDYAAARRTLKRYEAKLLLS